MRQALAAWVLFLLVPPLPSQSPFDPSPLHVAAAEGDIEALGRELAAGVSIDLQTTAITCSGRDGGDTALHWAARAGQAACVRWLLQRGARPVVEDNQRRTALDAAASAGRHEVIELLLAAGAQITTTTFVAAAFDVDTVRLLVQRGGDPRCGDGNGRTPLHCAELLGRADAVAELAFDRAIWFVPDHDGNTPLALAVAWRMYETVELAVLQGVLEDRKLPANSPWRERVAGLLRDAPRRAGLDDEDSRRLRRGGIPAGVPHRPVVRPKRPR